MFLIDNYLKYRYPIIILEQGGTHIMNNSKNYRVEVWAVEGINKKEEIRGVLKIQHLYDRTREHITRLIIDAGDDTVTSKEFVDLDIAIVAYMEATTLEEIERELESKVVLTSSELKEKSNSEELSIGEMISEPNTPGFIEVHGFRATNKKNMIIIGNIIKVQNYSTPTGEMKRIIYKRKGRFCLAEFPEKDFTFIYCSTGKTLKEFEKEYKSQLDNPPTDSTSGKIFFDILDDDEDGDPLNYDESEVNKKRPLGDNKIMFG